MNLNEQQAIEMAKKVFKDIDFEYYFDVPLRAVYDKDDKLVIFPQVKKTWTVVCKWFNPDFLSGMEAGGFLVIDDDTQKPVVLRLATGGGGNCVIQKDEKGKYYVEKNY